MTDRELPYNRQILIDMLIQHQHLNKDECVCGPLPLGASFAEHVADAYTLAMHQDQNPEWSFYWSPTRPNEWQPGSPTTDDFGRPTSWLWDTYDDEPTRLSFISDDYNQARALVYSAMCLRGSTMPGPVDFHDMILDVANAIAAERRRSNHDH